MSYLPLAGTDPPELPGMWYIWQRDREGFVFRSLWGYAELTIALAEAYGLMDEGAHVICVGGGNI